MNSHLKKDSSKDANNYLANPDMNYLSLLKSNILHSGGMKVSSTIKVAQICQGCIKLKLRYVAF